MAVKDFDRHYCLVIYSQGQWKEDYEVNLRSDVMKRFWHLSGHRDCHVCNTCPICQSIEELFSPEDPGEYDIVCGLCKRLLPKLKGLIGQADGLVLFSHYRPVEKELLEKIFEEEKVKKVFLLHLQSSKAHEFTQEMVDDLATKVTGLSSLLDSDIEDNVILEVRRDEYIR